jgi:hypothetical protein
MKKSMIVLLCLNSIYAGAQLKVNSNGKASIGNPITEDAQLNVAGDVSASIYEIKNGTTINGYLSQGSTLTSAWNNDPSAMAITYNKVNFAIGGFNKITPPAPATFSINLFVDATTNNVGINNTAPGYSLDVTGDIRTSGTVICSSDERIKKNITPLENALEKISRLNGKRYEKDVYFNNPEQKKSKQNASAVEYGVMAQDVQKVFPELVKTDANGIMGVNYIGLIPVLIEALKEQQEQITTQSTDLANLTRQTELLQKVVTAQEAEIADMKAKLNRILNTCCTQAKGNDDEIPAMGNSIKLYQNNPNPFSEKTEISFFLPQSVAAASLYIFNLQGSLLKEIPVKTRGKGSIVIDGAALLPGMYIYSLIVNGQEADSKRMVLTK